MKKAPYNGAQYAKFMTIALLAPVGVRMPPPHLNKYIFHRKANMAGKNVSTKFFYI
jgi:hypothetical protein